MRKECNELSLLLTNDDIEYHCQVIFYERHRITNSNPAVRIPLFSRS